MTSAKRLAGKRILVTRAREQTGGLAEALEAEGAIVLSLPTIDFAPPESLVQLDAALGRIENFDWLVFTSANAVRFFCERARALHSDDKRLAGARVAAIGHATAKSARGHGLSVELIPETFVAESLAEAFHKLHQSSPGEGLTGKRILFARAAVARDVIPRELMKLGAEIEVVEVYRTILPSASIDQARSLFENGYADAVTFTSSSTVTNFFALLAAAQVEAPRDLRAVSIGPVTTATLREHNWEPAAEAREARILELVEACVRLFQNRA